MRGLVIRNMPRESLRVPIAAPNLACGRSRQSSCDHAQEQFLSAQLRVAAMKRLEKLATHPFGHPDAASRNARVEFGVGQQPLESAILLLEILQPLGQSQSGGHRTASSFHEYVYSVTPIFLTASATVLPRPTSTSTSRSIGDDLLGQFFLSAWHGMPSFGFDTTRLSL